jgi:phage terminase large subunit
MPAALRIETPRAFLPLLEPSRYKGAWGGRGSAKSWFFADLLIEKCVIQPETRFACVREVQRSLAESVKRLLEDRIQQHGLGPSFRVLNTHIETGRDGRIIFVGMQNHTAESVKSLEGYDGAWIEEAQSISQRSLDLLIPTIRKDDSEIWAGWNPRFPTDPIDKFLRGPDKPPNAIVVRSNYRDNPFLPDTLRTEAEWMRQRDPEKYAHIWLGEYERHSEARVFKNWQAVDFETPTKSTFYYGADWGFSVDPTVLVRCFIDGRKLYIDREVYKIGCEIDHIPALFDTLDDGQARQWPITADSARPETISYLQRHGYGRMTRSKKGANSVAEGVLFLQNFDIIVHPRCRHTIDELTLYAYKTDSLTGKVLPILEDKKNHVIDALRYSIEGVRIGPAAAAIMPNKGVRW